MARGRCGWVSDDPTYVAYHDLEWGVPVWDDQALFAKLVLDGFQAGLSWITILRKRESFMRAFHDFDPQRIARYGERDRARLLADPGIVRNRAKIDATIGNARAYLALREPFAPLLWSFVGGEPKQNRCKTLGDVPAETAESRAMSKALRGLGFRFVGPTICYAFMQAVGMVNDHVSSCFRQREVARLA